MQEHMVRLRESGPPIARFVPGEPALSSEACAVCEAETPSRARFCPQCGARLHATLADPEQASGERRRLTVVFCDLVGSVELGTRLDPEDYAHLLGRFHRCVAETMARHGGFFARPMGDGALVFFGFPQAHEDDAERAVRASLATVEAVNRIVADDGRALRVKVGIATGVAVVGDVADAGQERGLDASGEAPNLASRLQGLAAPDTVLIADGVRRLLGALFVYRDLGLHAVKGWDTPIKVTQVLRPAANPSRFDARSGSRMTPLVGRDAAIEQLRAGWRAARRGAGRVVLVTGEPGLGKSRLAAQLMAETEFHPHARMRWFCASHQQGVAFQPCIQQLEHVAGLAREDQPTLRRAKLEALLRDAPDEEIGLIVDLLVPSAGASTMPGFARRRRERTLWALMNQLSRTCAGNPVLAIVEDAHWSDPSTAELLALVVAQAHALPLLLIVTARPEFKPDWLGLDAVEQLFLAPLTAAEGAALVHGMTGPGLLGHDVVRAIVERCDGVPLFIEEVTKAVLDTGPTGGAEPLRGGAEAVPASIHASLLARLDRLGEARRVAEAASVIGREFSAELLQFAIEATDPGVHDAVSRLAEMGLAQSAGPPGSGRFRFKHALIQDTAYGVMLRERRRLLHERVGRALASRFPEQAAAEPQVLAHHFTEARLADKAAMWSLRAGTQSMQRAATTEAIVQFRHGLAQNDTLPDSEPRRRLELELQLMLARAIAATQGHGTSSFGETLARAKALCVELDATAQLPSVLFFQWTTSVFLAELDYARQQAEELLDLAREQPDPRRELIACFTAGFTEFLCGSFQTARCLLQRGLALFQPDRRQDYGTVTDPRVLIRTYLAWEHVCTGNLAEAWAVCDLAVAEARTLGQPLALAHALTKLAHLRLCVGLPHSASVVCDELQSVADKHGIAVYSAFATCFRGWSRGSLGDAPAGLDLVRQGIQRYQGSGTRLHVPSLLRIEAEMLGRVGETGPALARLGEGWSLLRQSGERWEEAEFPRTEGALLRDAGEFDAAAEAFRRAYDIAARQGAWLFAMRAGLALAELGDRCSHPAATIMPLSDVLRRFPAAADLPELTRARALLDVPASVDRVRGERA